MSEIAFDTPREETNLTALAAHINKEWRSADDARIKIGRLLVEARDLHSRQGMGTWREWCTANIRNSRTGEPRSYRDVQRLIRLVQSEDPNAAAKAEREIARRGMQRTRERQSHEVEQQLRPASSASVKVEVQDDKRLSPAEPPTTLPKQVRIGKQVMETAALAPWAQEQIVRQLAAAPNADSRLPADEPEPVFEHDWALSVVIPAGSRQSDAVKQCEDKIRQYFENTGGDTMTRLEHVEAAFSALSITDELGKANPPEVIALPARLEPNVATTAVRQALSTRLASAKPLSTRVVEQKAVKHRFCSLGVIGCQHPMRCRKDRRCVVETTSNAGGASNVVAA